jgi:hypothetical protein
VGRRVGMSCLRSPIAMVSVLTTSRGLCGHYSWCRGIVSPRFSSVFRGCFVGTRTFDVCVIIYERPMTNHIRCIRHVVEATTPRWTSEGVMREAAREALAMLRHVVEEQMEQSQYHHFLSRAREGAEAVVMPTGDRNHIGCFTDQVKLTRALV